MKTGMESSESLKSRSGEYRITLLPSRVPRKHLQLNRKILQLRVINHYYFTFLFIEMRLPQSTVNEVHSLFC